MTTFKKKLLSCLVVLAIISNIFISFHHFGHKNHKISPDTGTIEHTHDCEHKTDHPNFSAIGYFAESSYHQSTDVCNVLNSIFKPLLKTIILTLSSPALEKVPYLNFCRKEYYSVIKILFIAPKNSPPLA